MTRERRTIGVLLPTLAPRGRVRVALRVANALAKAGELVLVIVPGAARVVSWPFLSGVRVGFAAIEPSDAKGIRFDLLIGTFWDTLPELSAYHARTRALLASGLEDRVDETGLPPAGEPPTVLDPQLALVCTSRALGEALVTCYGVDPARVATIPLPFDAASFASARPLVRKSERVRFLVQGRPGDRSRHVARTLALLENAGVEYLWVGAEVDRRLAGRGCVRIFEDVRPRDLPGIHASADVLVSLGDAPGTPVTPLEVFASGGTAILWDAPGIEEVVTHRHDALVCPVHSDEAVLDAVRALDGDRSMLEALRRAALETAHSHPSPAAQDSAIVEVFGSLTRREP